MLTLIYQGGPFRHDKGRRGVWQPNGCFQANVRAYYREYTVRTPGERSRGSWRIVCGGLQAAAPGCLFYTDDHSREFSQNVQNCGCYFD
jgi:ribonuclease T1